MNSRNGLTRMSSNLFGILKPNLSQRREKRIDKSMVPKLDESDLKEKFIKSEGPGGQFVNKRNTCVYLVHKPSGLSVKIGKAREQQMNRKLAREKMTKLLDNLINKEKSVENQKAQIVEEKLKKKIHKQKKLNEKKKAWKEIISSYNENAK